MRRLSRSPRHPRGFLSKLIAQSQLACREYASMRLDSQPGPLPLRCTNGHSDYCNTLHSTTPNGLELRESPLCDCLSSSHRPSSVRTISPPPRVQQPFPAVSYNKERKRGITKKKKKKGKHRLQSVSDALITDAYLVEAAVDTYATLSTYTSTLH